MTPPILAMILKFEVSTEVNRAPLPFALRSTSIPSSTFVNMGRVPPAEKLPLAVRKNSMSTRLS